MIVQPGERNSFDQRWLEYTLWDNHRIRLLRRSLFDINSHASFRADHAMVIDGYEVCRTLLCVDVS